MEVAAAAAITTATSSIFYAKKSADIQKKQIKKATAAAERDNELQRQRTQSTLQKQQLNNRSLLARQQAAYKAKLGAGGLSQAGSGQVVLDNMQKEHDAEDKYLTQQANISLQALQNSIDETKTRNLLTLKQQSVTNDINYINGLTHLGGTVGRAVIV